MAKSSKKESPKKTNEAAVISSMSSQRQIKLAMGILLILVGITLFVSFVSYFVNGKSDQSELTNFSNRSAEVQNWAGKIGAFFSDLFIYKGFGVASFFWARLLVLTGFYLVVDLSIFKLRKTWFWDMFVMIFVSILFGFFATLIPELGGVIGFELNIILQDYLGKIGTLLVILFGLAIYLIFKLKISPNKIKDYFNKTTQDFKNELKTANSNDIATYNLEEFAIEEEDIQPSKSSFIVTNNLEEDLKEEEMVLKTVSQFEINKDNLKPTIANSSDLILEPTIEEKIIEKPNIPENELVIQQVEEEDILNETTANKLVADFGEFDPTLDLSNFKFPSLELLKDYSSTGITINQSELEENKNKIVETLRNYKIEIAQIKATVGPSVTLYEIVPEAGIRISKIKSLEDDIALSLSALGIRIIAPIPGKGTIGIEVPNKNPSMVSMKSVIGAAKFQEAEMELPIALGKTISNETFVVDLAKMPHLLMAGATGQGKSVGLNAVLTSLLYKKHPAEVKFVLVDPKKVELTLFNKIERHYLAKLPDTDEAIITDNAKVVATLNSLCVEMDNRYTLLKDAMVRNIKEYNEKFKKRKLNPEAGHRFLPYIVLVVDEFADLIMTAGKEVELPIARLAQLARAIGIHLIIATQRPSVNVITGMIKANFPARIAFRVTSKIDSRTILDTGGADQLIGRGDMLYTNGNDLVRVQCAFVDTPEVEKITEFIGSQKAYATAYLLPEFIGEESGITLDIDISERDTLFREAAEVIVNAQQGSASLIQRKLKLGYNRAGRLIDQLEAAGIVGPFEGSKARAVNISDIIELDQFFKNEEK